MRWLIKLPIGWKRAPAPTTDERSRAYDNDLVRASDVVITSAPASLADLWVSVIRVAGGKSLHCPFNPRKSSFKGDTILALRSSWAVGGKIATAIARFSQGRRST